jgi:hypothetical protein
MLGLSFEIPTWAQELTAPRPPINLAFPTLSGSTPTDVFDVNIGDFPVSSQLAAGVLEGIKSSVLVPTSYSQAPQPNTAISGYVENNNSKPGNSAVAIYGFAQTNSDGANAYGGNFTAQNYRGPYADNGNDFENSIALELDTSIGHKRGKITPAGQATGLYIVGFSNVNPKGGSQAIYLRPFGSDRGIPWDVGYQTVDGATRVAALFGASGTGNNVGSQPIGFVSRTSGGTAQTTTLVADAKGDAVFTLPPGAVLSSSRGTRTAIVAVASLPKCDAEFEGTRYGVSDATAWSSGRTVTGGGSMHVPVYCDGTSWKIM